MGKYILIAGDVVDFTDPATKQIYRGHIRSYVKGRDPVPNLPHDSRRDYLVKFDTPWNNYDQAWCAAEDLDLVYPNKTTSFTTSYTHEPARINANQNIKINYSNRVQTSTISFGGNVGKNKETPSELERPWTAYYVTSDDFFEILRVAFNDTYGPGDHKWHPEDLYVNVSCVLEIVSNTLSNMININSKRGLNGVKGN